MPEIVKTPLIWQTPGGFDVGSFTLDLGGSPARQQSVIAIFGFNGRDFDRAILSDAAGAALESGDTEDLTALAAMILFSYQSRTHQTRWPVVWRGNLSPDRRYFRSLRVPLDWADVKTSAMGEAFGISKPISAASGGKGRPPLSELAEAIERSRLLGNDDIYAAHAIARWNAPPREYGEPSIEDLVWVENRARALYNDWKDASRDAKTFNLVDALNSEIEQATDLPAHAISRVAAWRSLMEGAYELLVAHRARFYALALSELRELTEREGAPAWIARTLNEAAALHEMFYRRSADFAGDLFQFERRGPEDVRLLLPSFADVAWEVWGDTWMPALLRATIDGDAVTRKRLLGDYHALAAFVAAYRGTRGEPSRDRVRRWNRTEDPLEALEDHPQSPEAPPDEVAHERHIMSELSAAIGPRDFRALQMHLIDGLTLEEVAKALGISKSRAQQLVTRAKDRLRASPKLLALSTLR